MHVEDVVLKLLEIVSCYLTDAAGPAISLAYDHPVGTLRAAALLMSLEEALTVEAFVAEGAFWIISGSGPW
jgi:hypothetical protein